MATFQSGGVRRATANTVASQIRRAERNRCPQCGRKSALKFHTDDQMFGSYCRWDDCGYERMTIK